MGNLNIIDDAINFNSIENLKFLGSRFGYKYSGKIKNDSREDHCVLECKAHTDVKLEITN